jgi:hypothetical protein
VHDQANAGAGDDTMMALDPIFVHASPRSGSTYFYNVLRRNPSLMCFNEAIIDVFSHYGKRGIGHFRAGQKWNVNHQFLDRDDFAEIIEAWDEVMHLYPPFPSFQEYLPPQGVLPPQLRAYLCGLINYAQGRDRRPALCEIHSRGRAGALRGAFGGFHIAQFRDPLSQFGSFIRPVAEGGEWGFLTFPLLELGISGTHPLCRLVPETWRVPVLPWPTDDRAQRWSSAIQYMALAASPGAASMERMLRWHLFSWTLSNLAAVCYSDFVLDMDRTFDDADYRNTVADTLASTCGAAPDLSDLNKFTRYYQFEGVDVAAVCDEVVSALISALHEGRVDEAIATLGTTAPTVPAADAIELLFTKIRGSLASMQASTDRRLVTVSEWTALTERHRKIWFNPNLRVLAQRIFPLAAPVVGAARRAGIWH